MLKANRQLSKLRQQHRFRSQFQPILASGGAEELLSRLREKNRELHAAIMIEELPEVSTRPVSAEER